MQISRRVWRVTLAVAVSALALLAVILTADDRSAAKPSLRSSSTASKVTFAVKPSAGCTRVRYTMQSPKDAVMYLAGTTPIKDWKMTAHGLQGTALMILDGGKLIGIDTLTFTLPVLNLKGEDAAMDKSAYKALKANRYKDITFRLSSASLEPDIDLDGVVEAKGELSVVEAKGELSVAGVTRAVTLTMKSSIASDGSISFTGSEAVKMSDYNVERPSVLLGAIKAGNAMTLSYTLIFSK